MEGQKNSSTNATPKHMILESNGNTYVVENVSQEKKGNSFMTHWKINKKQPFQFTNFSPNDFQSPVKKTTKKEELQRKRKSSLPQQNQHNLTDQEKRYSMNFEFSPNFSNVRSPRSPNSTSSQSPSSSPQFFNNDTSSPRKRNINEIEEISE